MPGGSLVDQRVARFKADRAKNKRSRAGLVDGRKVTNAELRAIVLELSSRVEFLEKALAAGNGGGA